MIQCQFRDTVTFPNLGIWLNIMHGVGINFGKIVKVKSDQLLHWRLWFAFKQGTGVFFFIKCRAHFLQLGSSAPSNGRQAFAHFFAISDDIFCALFAISFARCLLQLVISGRETMIWMWYVTNVVLQCSLQRRPKWNLQKFRIVSQMILCQAALKTRIVMNLLTMYLLEN